MIIKFTKDTTDRKGRKFTKGKVLKVSEPFGNAQIKAKNAVEATAKEYANFRKNRLKGASAEVLEQLEPEMKGGNK